VEVHGLPGAVPCMECCAAQSDVRQLPALREPGFAKDSQGARGGWDHGVAEACGKFFGLPLRALPVAVFFFAAAERNGGANSGEEAEAGVMRGST